MRKAADDHPVPEEPALEKPSYWPYKSEEHKRLIETEIRLLLALETYERQVWGDAWPPPLPRGHARWRREFSRKLWGDEPRPGHQYAAPIRRRERSDANVSRPLPCR